MKKAYVCPKTRPLTICSGEILQITGGSIDIPPSGDGTPVMGNDVKGTAASGRLW